LLEGNYRRDKITANCTIIRLSLVPKIGKILSASQPLEEFTGTLLGEEIHLSCQNLEGSKNVRTRDAWIRVPKRRSQCGRVWWSCL
jgi:hypothetical protein